MKSSYALQRPVITENVTITNCQLYGYEVGTLLDGTRKRSEHQNGRIKFGTESNRGFRNITICNYTFSECRGWRWRWWTAAFWKMSPSIPKLALDITPNILHITIVQIN